LSCHLKYKKLKTRNFLSVFFYTLMVCGISYAQNPQTDSLKKLLVQVKNDTSKINLYNKIADKFKEVNPDSTTHYANMATALSLQSGYGYGLANSFVNAGNGAIISGNYTNALKNFLKAKAEFQKLLNENPKDVNLERGLARAFASCGVVYSEQSNHYLALENYQQALKIYQEINDQASVSKALNNIGIVYKAQQNYLKALEYLKKAHSIQVSNDESTAPVTLTNIGVIYFEMGQNENAFVYYSKAQKQFGKHDNKRGVALLNTYLGDYYKKQNNTKLANEYYNKSLVLYNELQNKFGASLALYNIGKLLQEQKLYKNAMPYALQSLAYAKEIGVLDQTYHSEKLLSELYEAQNNPKASLEHYKNYISARDSIANEEVSKKFALAEMNYEYKKKETLLFEKNKRQIQFIVFSIIGVLLLIALVLVLYNKMQVKKRLTLKKEVAEYEQKALHLQMNPHFVFNCLSSISSFIVQNGTDSALKYLSKFSKLMRLTLEYSKGSLIPIDKEIESLQNYLELEQLRFHDKFKFAIRSTDKVEFNMGLPPLLIQPFVENAILHGVVPKEGGGKIDVGFDVQDSQLVCTITDDGIGLSESRNLKENSVTAHKSMALEITKKRLEIMESITSKAAQIEITDINTSNKKTGTKVTLRLPIQYIP